MFLLGICSLYDILFFILCSFATSFDIKTLVFLDQITDMLASLFSITSHFNNAFGFVCRRFFRMSSGTTITPAIADVGERYMEVEDEA